MLYRQPPKRVKKPLLLEINDDQPTISHSDEPVIGNDPLNSNLPSPAASEIDFKLNLHATGNIYGKTPLWLEQLVQPKPSGPDPFPLRKPHAKSPTKPVQVLKQYAFELKLDEVDNFFKNTHQYAIKMAELDLLSQEGSESRKVHCIEELEAKISPMVISKHSYEKLTQLVLNEINDSIKAKNNTRLCMSIPTFNINEIIKLPESLVRLHPKMQMQLALLATMHEVEKDKILQRQEELRQNPNTPRTGGGDLSFLTTAFDTTLDLSTSSIQLIPDKKYQNSELDLSTQSNDVSKDVDKSLPLDQVTEVMSKIHGLSTSTGTKTSSSTSHQATPIPASMMETPTKSTTTAHEATLMLASQSTPPLCPTSTHQSPLPHSHSCSDIALACSGKKNTSKSKKESFIEKLDRVKSDAQLPTKSDLYILYSLLAQQGEVISLRAHFIESLPRSLLLIPAQVMYLNLSFNQLTEIPQSFLSECINLEVLTLRNNPIRKLVLSKKLQKLRFFAASFCMLEEVPEYLTSLGSLEKIDLSYNRITNLPASFSDLTPTLNELDISGNEIFTLPATMLQLNLSHFRYDHNFTHPIFWKGYVKNTAKSLKDLCYMAIEKYIDKESIGKDIVEDMVKGCYNCITCGRVAYGEKVNTLRPCKEIWGKLYVPFVFECCCAEGRAELFAKPEIMC